MYDLQNLECKDLEVTLNLNIKPFIDLREKKKPFHKIGVSALIHFTGQKEWLFKISVCFG